MRKKMTTIVAMLLLAAAQIFANGAQDTNTNTTGDERVTLTVHNNVDMTAPEGKTWDAVKRAFLANNPNIDLEVEIQYGDAYLQKVAARAAAQDMADVVYVFPGMRSGELIQNELLEDLTPYLTDDVRAQFKPAVLSPQLNGGIWEMPYAQTTTSVLYVNQAVLAEAGLEIPKTYEEMAAMKDTFSGLNKDILVMGNQPGWVMSSCLFGTILGRIAGPQYIRDLVDGKAKFTDKPFVQALTFVQQMYDDGVLKSSSLQLAYGQAPGEFGNNNAPFLVDGDWRVGAIMDLYGRDAQENDIQLMAFPEIPGEKYGNTISMVGSAGFGMKAGLTGAKKEAALKLVFFYAGEEAARIRLFAEGIFPAYNLDMDMYSASLQPLALKRAALYSTYEASDVIDNWLPAQPNDALNNGLQAIGLGTISPEDLAKELEAVIER